MKEKLSLFMFLLLSFLEAKARKCFKHSSFKNNHSLYRTKNLGYQKDLLNKNLYKKKFFLAFKGNSV
jgi:hypothetical protein